MRRDRCVEDVEYTTELCELECFSEQLVRHAGCLLPFMKLSHTSPYKRNSSICNTTAPTYRATVEQMKLMLTGDETIWVNTLFDRFIFVFVHTIIVCYKMNYNRSQFPILIQNRTGCNCIASCFKTYYETDKEKAMSDPKQNRFRFRVFFQVIQLLRHLFISFEGPADYMGSFSLHLFHAVYTIWCRLDLHKVIHRRVE